MPMPHCAFENFSSDNVFPFSFSNLFSSSNKPKRPLPIATVKYNAPTTNVQPVGDPNKKQRDKSSNPKSKAYDFLQEDLWVHSKRCFLLIVISLSDGEADVK